MRLIDADAFKDMLEAYGVLDGAALIADFPTIYDVDKVMRRLDESKSGLTTWAEDEAYKLGIEKAIEIIGAEMER